MPSLPDKLKDPPPAPFFWGGSAWDWLTKSLQNIYLALRAQQPPAQEDVLKALATIHTTLEILMATVAELQTSLDALTAADAENAQRTSDELAQLQAALEAITPGEPVTQAQLDQVNAVVAAMQARNATMAADDPTPPTP